MKTGIFGRKCRPGEHSRETGRIPAFRRRPD
jgi:hypothetical protein